LERVTVWIATDDSMTARLSRVVEWLAKWKNLKIANWVSVQATSNPWKAKGQRNGETMGAVAQR
jgi:hypothetical protein